MQLSRYAFIVKGPDYFPEQHTSELRSPKFSTRVVGVSDYQTALLIAEQLIADGIQLIELCGGFTESEAVELQLSTGKKIPIGVVKYDDVLE
ncbi:DUF6506 family protein [Ralstonia chuxiongensis]|uniref:DUF6506 family protein n=1 Tax=Ralstonia chuxiongensis TaxID=2957504 RepID=UPI002930D89B|nr:DUF6506 family protein [Ralstonia chuxiongensis]